MKTHSELQEDYEQRKYILKDDNLDCIYTVFETFYYYKKRGSVFPSQHGRKGRQQITIRKGGQYLIIDAIVHNVWESDTARKRSIYKVIREHMTNYKNLQCVIKDKFPQEIDSFHGCIEFVESLFNYNICRPGYNIEYAEAADPVKLHFNREIWKEQQEKIIKALTPRVSWCKFVDNKTLHVKYIPAP